MPSVTRTPGRTQLRRGEIEEQVFAAVELLLAAGDNYTTLGVQRICARAGVARSSFYSVFADKTDLILRLAGRATEGIFGGSEEFFTVGAKVDADGLTATQLNSIRVFREHAPLIRALTELAAYDSAVAGFWSGRMENVIATTAAWIAREQTAGRIRAQLDPATAARFIVHGAERCMLHQVGAGEPADDARAATDLSDLVLTLLYGHPASG